MRKILTTCLCSLFASFTLFAQDIIITTDARKIEAKILEVSKTEIKYKEQSNLNGPTFILETKEISSIIYSNGQVKVYNQAPQNEALPKEDIAATTEETPVSVASTINESTAQILLLSGQSLTVQITDLKSNYVAYILDGKSYTLPASQISKVTFLQNGQVRDYSASAGVTQTESSSGSRDYSPKYVSRNGNTYYYDGRAMNESSYSTFLQNNCPAAYDMFNSGNNIAFAGWIFFSVGVGADLGSLIGYLIAGRTVANTAFSIIGLGFEIACIPTLIVGYNKKHRSADIFNTNCSRRDMTYWSINASQNGIGIAYNF